MKMNTVYTYETSFSKTIMDQKSNSADIQFASDSEDYCNKDMLHYENTEMNLKLYDNVLMDKYYNKIKQTAKVVNMTPEMNTKYKYRPEALSTDQFGFPGLWYMILYLNGCEDCSEFHDFDYVLVPSADVVQSCLLNEEFIKNKEPK